MDGIRLCCAVLCTHGNFSGCPVNLLGHGIDLLRGSCCFFGACCQFLGGGRYILDFSVQCIDIFVNALYDNINIGSLVFYLCQQSTHGIPHGFQFLCQFSEIIAPLM